MTLEELQAIVQDVAAKSSALLDASQQLNGFFQEVLADVHPSNPLSAAINVDAYVAIQTPIYLAKLTAVEAAADLLGSDLLH